jgi:hypothetical protein
MIDISSMNLAGVTWDVPKALSLCFRWVLANLSCDYWETLSIEWYYKGKWNIYSCIFVDRRIAHIDDMKIRSMVIYVLNVIIIHKNRSYKQSVHPLNSWSCIEIAETAFPMVITKFFIWLLRNSVSQLMWSKWEQYLPLSSRQTVNCTK